MSKPKTDDWLFEIKPKDNLLRLNLKEVWQYRDLLMLFVKRDVVTVYKQTVLGPLWYLIQPLITSLIFTLIFNNIANISTGTIPPFLFNLAGVTTWNYFKECLRLNTELDNDSFAAQSLYELILLTDEMNLKEDSRKYFIQLEKITQENPNKKTKLLLRLSRGLLLKNSNRIKDRGEAHRILEEIADEEPVFHELIVTAMLNLCELLIFELETIGDRQILLEILSLTDKITEFIKIQHNYKTHSEILLMQSKISILNSDIDKAISQIKEAQIIRSEEHTSELQSH